MRSGVNGTPAIFINGARCEGPNTAAALIAGIHGDPGPSVEPITGRPLA